MYRATCRLHTYSCHGYRGGGRRLIVFEELDELARGLAENEVSRRQAIKWAGYSVLGATLSSMGFAERAEALTRNARRRCRKHGGTPLEKGNCHCAGSCAQSGPAFFHFP